MRKEAPSTDSDSLAERAAKIDIHGEFSHEFKDDIDRAYLIYKTLYADANSKGNLFWQRGPLFEDLAREYQESIMKNLLLVYQLKSSQKNLILREKNEQQS